MTGRPLFGRPETALPEPLTKQEVRLFVEILKADEHPVTPAGWVQELAEDWLRLLTALEADGRESAREYKRLLDEIALLQRRLAEAERVNDRVVKACTDAATAADMARATLEFYAQQYGLGARLASDGGQKARDALAAMKRQR